MLSPTPVEKDILSTSASSPQVKFKISQPSVTSNEDSKTDPESTHSLKRNLCSTFAKMHISTTQTLKNDYDDDDLDTYFISPPRNRAALPLPPGYIPTRPRNDYERFLSNQYEVLTELKELYSFDGGFNDSLFPLWATSITDYFQKHKFPRQTWLEVIPHLLTGKAWQLYYEKKQLLPRIEIDWRTFVSIFYSEIEMRNQKKRRFIKSLEFQMNGTPETIIKVYRDIAQPSTKVEVFLYSEMFIALMPARCQTRVRKALEKIAQPTLEEVFDAFLKNCHYPIYTNNYLPCEYPPGYRPPWAINKTYNTF